MENYNNIPPIHLVSIPKSQWEELIAKIDSLQAPSGSPGYAGYEVYDTTDLVKLLKVSTRTLANWRETGVISYTKIGGKILYRDKDVEECLERNRIESRRI